MKKLLACGILVALCMGLFGCRGTADERAPRVREQIIYREKTVLHEETVYRLQYQDITFVTDEERAAWREPLIALLSRLGGFVVPGERSGRIEYTYGWGVALMDLTMDGTPELMIRGQGGVSSGIAGYTAFDLYTGERVGGIDVGNGDTWCIYYNTETGEFEWKVQFWWRYGWARRSRHLQVLHYYEESGKYISEDLLSAYYTIEGEITDATEPDENGIYTGTWVEWYPETEYFVEGESASIDEYYDLYDHFMAVHVRIPQTALQSVAWYSLEGYEVGSSPAILAEEMADALLSLDQAFIRFDLPMGSN